MKIPSFPHPFHCVPASLFCGVPSLEYYLLLENVKRWRGKYRASLSLTMTLHCAATACVIMAIE
jgi:hypothetical protein